MHGGAVQYEYFGALKEFLVAVSAGSLR
eukprot:COSAG02_NODE_29904_length_560_cov_1.724512_1_plen_27_part_10